MSKTCQLCGADDPTWWCEGCDKHICPRCSQRGAYDMSSRAIYCPLCRRLKKKGKTPIDLGIV